MREGGSRESAAKERVLSFMREKALRPLSFKDLVHVFGVPRDRREEFKRLIKGMVAGGDLIETREGRFATASRLNLVTGLLTCHTDGYGFVEPEEGGTDIFIPPRKMGGAMHGDKVAARVEGAAPGRKREGKVIRVVERAHRTIVGRFEKEKNFGVVIPSDQRILEKVVIPPGESMNAPSGVIVEAEITRWPTKEALPAGRVVEVIGDPEDPDVEVTVIMREYGLPMRFPHPVMEEVRHTPSSVREADADGRVDLRGRKVFTIDGETARDFDDAVSIERTRRGFRLFVSIADVSHYVREGSALDSEALRRGTSVYFPDRCIPMLPESLSNGICSLNPGVDRLTLTAEIEFDESGAPVKKRFYESVIRSVERLTYTNVKRVVADGEPQLKSRYAHILEDLKLMEELALLLMERRREAGSIDFDLPEPQIIIDIEGRIEDIVRSERNIAHRIIEEFMLAANRAVAEEFTGRKLPSLFRVHDPPEKESIDLFKEFISGFGLELGGATPRAFQKVLREAEGSPRERLINHVLLRSMKQARYSEGNTGHFGLAFDNYTHFTSPIRRYPDLVVHRLLKLLVHGRYTPQAREKYEGSLPHIAARTSSTERKAMEAEREILDLKKAQFMKDKVGGEFDGLISGVTGFGIFIELLEYFVEGLVHVSTLTDDYYVFDEKRHTLTGRHTKRAFHIGDPVRVTVSEVDLERKRIDFALVEKRPRRGRRAPPGRPR